jgi:enoyl-CoA hydratase/carnithine racemase
VTQQKIQIERAGPLRIVRMIAGDNLVDMAFLDAFNAALDELEREPEDIALVTVGEGKLYSTGFDRAALADPAQCADLVERAVALCGRLMSFPVPSCAAINGHAFGIGAMLALSQDFRVMRADRGFMGYPELSLGLPLHPGMYALLMHRIPTALLHEMLLGGVRIGGARAAQAHVVDEACAEHEVLPRALERAHALLGRPRALYREYKRNLHRAPLEVIERGSDFRFPVLALST